MLMAAGPCIEYGGDSVMFKVEFIGLTRCPEAEEAARIAAERISEIEDKGPVQAEQVITLTFHDQGEEGYTLEIAEHLQVVITANRRRNFIAGVGGLLEKLHGALDHSELVKVAEPAAVWSDALQTGIWRVTPQIPVRTHYMPGHFGNSFEVCWNSEMLRYLEDLALAGASSYGDWFDPNDMPDPYNPHVFHSTSMFLWRRKKEWLSYSQQLGLDNILVITPNIGYVDQMRPEWVGTRDHKLHVQGQVLCPSNPQAREVILRNQQQLFDDLHQSGIRIGNIVCAPYDDGGCACEKCQPYYPIFLKLVHDVYETVRVYYPSLKVDICGWWTSEEESRQLREFAAGPARGWFGSFQFSATYGVFEVPDVSAHIGDLTLGCFLHIGFSHDNRDVYTRSGIHSAPQRIQSVIRSFAKRGCQGFMTYNESFGDHYNAFVASQLGWNPDKDIRDITLFYCSLILGVRGQARHQIADLLLELELLEAEKAAGWAETLANLKSEIRTSPVQSAWAFAHLQLKADMMALDHVIETRLQDGQGIEQALPEMRQRVELGEYLWRHVYGFGVLRHILIPDRMQPEWYHSYMQHVGERKIAQNPNKTNFMSQEA